MNNAVPSARLNDTIGQARPNGFSRAGSVALCAK